MIAHKKKFSTGVVLLIGFAVVLGLLFSSIYPGPHGTKQNGLNYLDSLYNSISKDSANYIPAVRKSVAEYAASQVGVTLKLADEKAASQTVQVLEKAGLDVKASGSEVTVNGTMGQLLESCLTDAQHMYDNDGKAISARYDGMDERLVVYTWYQALKALSKQLNHQEKFKDAKIVDLVVQKAVELSYNYYKIEPLKITQNIGVVTFSLVFYVIYTLWFGFAVLFMFEGWGLKLEH